MQLTKRKKKILKIAMFAGIGVVVISIVINLVAQSSIKKFLNEELVKLNSNADYTMSVSDVSVGVLQGNITLRELAIRPTDSLRQAMQDNDNNLRSVREATFSSLKLRGFSILGYLLNKEVNLSGIRLDRLKYRVEENSNIRLNKAKKKKGKFALDSLQIPGIVGIDPGKIEIDNYTIEVIESGSGDTLTNYVAKSLMMSDVKLTSLGEGSDYLQFDTSDLRMELDDQEYTFSNGLYSIAFDELVFSRKEELLTISNFKYGPVASARETANKYTFTNDIYDAKIETLSVSGFDLRKLIVSGVMTANYVELDSLNLTIFKDKRLPWNYDKRPQLPNQSLQTLKLPLKIDSVRAKRAYLDYTEQLAEDDKMIHIFIDDLQLGVDHITSIKSEFDNSEPLGMHLTGDLLNTMPFEVNLEMPYTSTTFRYWGKTGAMTTFESINPIIYPAINMKFEGGELNGIDFAAVATPTLMEGEMTMSYKDLEVQVFTNEKKRDKNNTVSWLANSFAKQSNPKKNGKLSVARMDFERVMYKGIGNYLWKGLQSGIINSIIPFGKRKKQ
ncbi:hypothetical protein [Aureitalea marina]|uniref:DUF748 domain-containing protein n=1 Tax=Aureitalea marina TaxID=930804 RepID=A0A2S7KPX1_9FLAO|nr:hypothetical protein [Aureitalea marina]PQB04674.1 hypothetical protein BST85_07030 [Aureitalea marina]